MNYFKNERLFLGIFILNFMLLNYAFTSISPLNLFLSKEEQRSNLLYSSIEKTAKKIAKKYGLYFSSIGGGTSQKGEKTISVGFHYHGKVLLMDEARKMLNLYFQDFLKSINQDKDIQEYFGNKLVTVQNIKFTVINYDGISWNQPLDPNICVMQIHEGIVCFKIMKDPKLPGYATIITETYEEALEILRTQQSNQENKVES